MKKFAGVWRILTLGAILAAPQVLAANGGRTPITVFGAASLTDVLQDLGDAFTKDTSIPVRFSFASSATLARQIESGAPADLFFSADIEWMDYLQARALIRPATRVDMVGNQLILVAPVDSKVTLKIEPHFPLAATLGKGRLATGDPDSVPVGRYAKESLIALGVWDSVSTRLVRADSVRAALAFVDRGETPLGIVYATDALADKKVRFVDAFPAASHEPIIYPAALTNVATADAAKFLAYLRGPAGDLAFKRYGFMPLH
jgi:molybdate transport system substrate-binding protein